MSKPISMKKYLSIFSIILLFSLNSFSQDKIPDKGMESRQGNFTELKSRPVPQISEEFPHRAVHGHRYAPSLHRA